MKVLVTGGAGYIGSHTVLSLLDQNSEVIVLDNLVNGSVESLKRIADITGKEPIFYEGSILDDVLLNKLFSENKIDSVIHFAGLKSVGESMCVPMDYYENNVSGTINLVKAMSIAKVKSLVFSSSATVYGIEAPVPYVESMSRGTSPSPYGSSKSIVERMLEDLCASDLDWGVVCLRYFNPVGAHESGRIGESPLGVPNNLMPFISQVAIGVKQELSIYGDDYATPDGTCRRDYLHVMDLAEGHIKALDYLKNKGAHIFNLGTGLPVSVLEMVRSFEDVTGLIIPYSIVGRRLGDIDEFWACPEKAERLLKWKANRSLKTMIVDTWKWQSQNPFGYGP